MAWGNEMGCSKQHDPWVHLKALAIICSVCLLSGPAGSQAESEYVPRTGFVTLQFDDSRDLHYTHVFPLLETHGFKGTFGYITESSELGIEGEAWKMQEMYQAGHEVQDHTTRHDYRWASHVDTVDNGIREWIPWTFVDSTAWDSLCERSLFILDSLGIEAIGWNYPGGGTYSVPDHPTWKWLGAVNDTMYRVIGRKYPYGIGYGVFPHTAHLNLRGHNRPDRYPFFSVPHVTFDDLGLDEIKTGIADAVAAGLWYVAVGHVRTLPEVDKLDSLLEWLDDSDIEVLRCCDGWQRIEFGQPDPAVNQLPQARMATDLDGNNKPDGFTGACAWDTLTVPPMPDVGCMCVYGQVDFYCYGPELGTNSLSMWVKSATGGPVTTRVITVKSDFEWGYLGNTNTGVQVSTEWTKIDSSVHSDFVWEIEDEVDRVLIRLKPTEGDTLLVAHPEVVCVYQAGVDVPDECVPVDITFRVRPNPVRRGMPLRIKAGTDVDVYDILGRWLIRYAPDEATGFITIDTSSLAEGVYFLEAAHGWKGRTKVVIY